MIRKAIQLAGKTIVISLPNEWVKENNIRKGDEINVVTKGKDLILKGEKEPYLSAKIDVRGMKKKVIRWVLSSYYQKGYDEMEIYYDNQEVSDLINKYIKDLFIGFAIIKQSENTCVIRSITTEKEIEFKSLLRRSFLVAIELGRSTQQLLKKKKYDQIEKLINLEVTNNQLTLFCTRVINKKKLYEKNNHFLFSLIWDLEKIADDFKYICKYINRVSKNENFTISDDVLNIFESVNNFFYDFYDSSYEFNYKKFNILYDKKVQVLKKARDVIRNTNSHESIIINYLISIIHKLSDMMALTVAINTN